MNAAPHDGDGSDGGDHAGQDAGAARDWLDPALARLAFGSSSSNAQSTTPGIGHLALDLPQMLELDLGVAEQREFGDYELREVIGRGGMGVVYRAHQRSLDRDVALKLLSAGLWASSEYVATLRREAQHAALLQHPNIVTVYEIGEHHGLIYYAMQLFGGNSLAMRLQQDGPLAPHAAASLLRNAAEALDYAHRLGVLHLDLKPGNVLLDEEGSPRIADFGLARRLGISGDADNERVSGTPSYMAPEQAQVGASKLSRATDVWGLGALLYEMLCGKPPFTAASPGETLRLVQEGQVRSLGRHVPVPPDLEAICRKCLAKAPAERYASARALADDLSRFLEGRAVSVRPLNVVQRLGRWARREPKLALTGALATLALVVGLAATTTQWRRAQASAAASNALLWDSRREASLQLQSEGKGWDALPRLVANIREEDAAGKAALATLDRRRLGMLFGQGAILVDRIPITDARALAVQVDPAGNTVAIGFDDASVRWYDAHGLRERGRVSLTRRPTSDGQPRLPLLLRFIDGHRLLVTLDWISNKAAPNDGDSWLVDLDRGALVEPPPAFDDFASATFSPDGRVAILGDHRGRNQCWRLDPWRPCSPLSPAPQVVYAAPWKLVRDDRQAVMLRAEPRHLDFYALDDLSHPQWSITPPGNTGISAWGDSHGGRWMALGDFEGRLYLLDLDTRAIRRLPTPRSREITWIAFSADDAWLAAVTWDGYAYAFDVASGNTLVAGQMQHDFAPQWVAIDRRQRLLLVSGGSQVYGASSSDIALWRLPEQGPRASPASRIGLVPAGHGLAGRYPVGWSQATGLFASTGADGQLQLWRLPRSPLLAARAANQIPEQLQFDGRQVVDVAWDRLRLVSTSGAARTPWLRLPQPPGFAELVDAGRTLVVTSGPQLRIYDAPRLRLRLPPLPLPASPQRLAVSADGERVVTSYGASDASGFHEQLLVHDLRNGRRLPASVRLPGPLRRLEFSPDHARLLVQGAPTTATWVFDTDSLHRIGDYPHDAFQPVTASAFALDGREVLLGTAARSGLGQNRLLRWDPRTDTVRDQHGLGPARPVGLVDSPAGPLVAGIEADFIDPGGAHASRPRRLAQDDISPATAVSADGRLFARAYQRHVQLLDAATGANIGPPLAADIPAMDTVLLLAISPDGRQLLARTLYGHWLHWNIGIDPRPLDAIAADLERLRGPAAGQAPLRPSPAEHALLHARDPGPWPRPQQRPQPASLRSVDGLGIPARRPGTSPLLLDLTDAYDFAPESVHNTFFSVLPALRPRPAGVQRIAGIDYDLRGMIQVDTPRSQTGITIPVPPVPVAALHVLMTVSTPTPITGVQAVAEIRLHYLDGSQALLPIRTQREVPGYTARDRPVPLAWAQSAAPVAPGSRELVLSAPRLANPHPERLLRAIDLRLGANGAVNTPVVLAVTLEPVTAAAVLRNAPIQKHLARAAPARVTGSSGPANHRRSP